MNDARPSTQDRWTAAILGALAVLDVVLATWALAFPELWFRVFHGTSYDDPEALLRRCGATWAAYAVLQSVAFRRWRTAPEWLAVVAGLRLGEMFSDWAYVGFARQTTWLGTLALIAACPVNVAAGVFLLRAYRRRTNALPG